jgi:hypothetical protein
MSKLVTPGEISRINTMNSAVLTDTVIGIAIEKTQKMDYRTRKTADKQISKLRDFRKTINVESSYSETIKAIKNILTY